MKKLFSVLLLIALLISSFAYAEALDERLSIVATTYPLYDMAKNIAGDMAEVIYAPEDAQQAAAKADLVLCVGSEADAWVEELEGVSVVKAVNGIEVIENDCDVLTIPLNNMICASYLAEELAVLDSANNEAYQMNLVIYVGAMSELDLRIQEVVHAAMHVSADANTHDHVEVKVYCNDGSMAYFAKEYGVTIVTEPEDAIELSTYNFPVEEDQTVAYIDLMARNTDALAQPVVE